MLRAALLGCCLGSLSVSEADSLRTSWSFAWDLHPQASALIRALRIIEALVAAQGLSRTTTQ